MSVAEVRAALGRRWYLVVVGLLVTGGLAFGAWQVVPFTYEAKGTVLLLPPSYEKADGSNPFLGLGGLDLPASVVVAYLDGDVTREKIAAIAPTSTYEVQVDSSIRGPAIAVTVDDPTQAGALFALEHALDAVPAALTELQNQLDVPASASITSMRLAVDTTATTVTKETMRAVVAVVGACLIGLVLFTVLLDGLLGRARERRDAKRLSEASESATPLPGLSGPLAAAPPASDELSDWQVPTSEEDEALRTIRAP